MAFDMSATRRRNGADPLKSLATSQRGIWVGHAQTGDRLEEVLRDYRKAGGTMPKVSGENGTKTGSGRGVTAAWFRPA